MHFVGCGGTSFGLIRGGANNQEFLVLITPEKASLDGVD
jgi:hypothetical protein